jgi:hypothetical protein
MKNGQTDWRIGGFRHRWATIFTTPMAIGRCRKESRQRPTTGTKADGSQPNGESSRATIFTGMLIAGTAQDVGAIRVSPEGKKIPVVYQATTRLFGRDSSNRRRHTGEGSGASVEFLKVPNFR